MTMSEQEQQAPMGNAIDDVKDARHAATKDEATHRFITHVRWGKGYFGDGYRYLVAKNDDEAFEFAKQNGAVKEKSEVKAIT